MATIARPGPFGRGKYAQVTSLSTAVSLSASLPTGTGTLVGDSNTYSDLNCALVQAETQNVRWRDDGTAPTTTVGHVLAAGESMLYEGDLNQIKFIEVTASAKLNVTFYAKGQV
jgi:hypothetical protein